MNIFFTFFVISAIIFKFHGYTSLPEIVPEIPYLNVETVEKVYF